MSTQYLVVKSVDPPETVTDPLDFVNDEEFKSDDYRAIAASLLEAVVWTGDEGKARLGACEVALEPTDAGLFLQFTAVEVPTEVIRSLVIRARRLGAVVMSTDTGDIVTAP